MRRGEDRALRPIMAPILPGNPADQSDPTPCMSMLSTLSIRGKLHRHATAEWGELPALRRT
eukprot:49862-Eustigmatos_ZCMA.PRE.1